MSSRLQYVSRVLESIVSAYPYVLLGLDLRGRVVYQTTEGGFSSIWALDSDGSKKKLTEKPILWTAEVSESRDRVVFTRDIAGGRELQLLGYIDLHNDNEVVFENMEPMRIFSIVNESSRIVFTGATERGMGLYMIKSGSIEKILDLKTITFATDVRYDLIVGSGNLRGDPRSSEIFIYDLSTNQMKIYTPREGSSNNVPIILEDKKILFQTNALDPDRFVLATLDPYTSEFRLVEFPYRDYENFKPVENVFYKEFDRKILVIGKKEGRSRIFIDGREINTPRGIILNADLFQEKVYFTYTNILKPARIMVAENSGYREIIGSRLPEDIESMMGDIEFRYIESLDGLKIPLFVIRSRGHDMTKSAVVYIHGGPWSEVADSWSVLIASLVASGFNVIAPNFRGSTGYGESFRRLDIGDPGGGDLLDIEAAARFALENKLGERLFVMGYSYGGYMTLWTMFNKPDLFDCGVAGAAVADWEEMYEISDALFKQFIEVLFDKRKDLLRERSPINKAENLKKPLCIIQPQNDTRTPLKPIMRLLNKLMESGKTFEAHIVPDMGHVMNTIDNAIKIVLPAILFLYRCVDKRT
ncbi:MAG: S9 family peptidase [Sulfolobales archaeon]